MPLPTLLVTPDATGTTINTLPSSTAADPGAVPVATPLASTSTATSITSAASTTVILAANTARKRYSIFNDSTAVMYVLENSGTVSATNYSYQIAAGGYFNTTEWQGAVNAIWASVNGAARVTEYTA